MSETANVISQLERKVSEAAQDVQARDSVYDFLYCDARRVAAYLSQFDNFGHLNKITHRESVSRNTKRGFKFGAGGGGSILGTGGQGSASIELGPDAGASEASEKSYDPLWVNALTLLDFLDERQLIKREIRDARIGQFLVASGALSIIDLTLFQTIWSSKGIRAAIAQSSTDAASASASMQQATSRQARRLRERRGEAGPQASNTTAVDAAAEIFGIMPHTIQARMNLVTNDMIWSTLVSDGLVTSASDLFLKHGVTLGGEWIMLSVIDALPDSDMSGELTPYAFAQISQSALVAGNPFGELLNELTPFVRQFLGRPLPAYGATPLLIFREVSTHANIATGYTE